MKELGVRAAGRLLVTRYTTAAAASVERPAHPIQPPITPRRSSPPNAPHHSTGSGGREGLVIIIGEWERPGVALSWLGRRAAANVAVAVVVAVGRGFQGSLILFRVLQRLLLRSRQDGVLVLLPPQCSSSGAAPQRRKKAGHPFGLFRPVTIENEGI